MLEPRKGDRVSWKSHGGTARGKVVRKLTAPTMIKGHKAMASKENPEFLVETDEGKRAVHKAEALGKGLRSVPTEACQRAFLAG